MAITYGTEYDFGTPSGQSKVAKLDDTHIAISFVDAADNYKGKVVIGTISNDDEITFGSAYEFHPSAGETFICALSSTTFIVSELSGARLGTVTNDNEISFGGLTTFNASSTYVSLSALSSTSFVVAYRDNGGDTYGHCKIGTVSGTTITLGNEYTFNSAATTYISVKSLSSTSFVVGYIDNGNSSYPTAIVGIVSSGTVITYGSEYVAKTAGHSWIGACKIDSTHFIIGYNGYLKIGTISNDDEIAYGSEYSFNGSSSWRTEISLLDSATMVITYRDLANSSRGTANIGIIDISYVVTFSDKSVVYNSDAYSITSTSIDGTHFVATYEGGRTKIGTYSEDQQSTNIQINIGDSWKEVSEMKINIGDSWKTVVGAKINIGDVWKDIF